MRLVSIIIPTFGKKGLDLTIQCLKSIEKVAHDSLSEIIVVDDGSEINDFKKILEEELPDVRYFDKKYLIKEGNTGFCRTCNVGIENARKENDIILLNNDTIAENDFITLLRNFAYKNDEIGIVGPKLIYPDGLGIQSAGSFLPTGMIWFDHIGRFKPIGDPKFNKNYECVGVTGACMYIKRDVIDKIGPLDTEFPMTFEDADYCLRAKEAGFEIWYNYEPLLTHLENATKSAKTDMMQIAVTKFWKRYKVAYDDNKKGIIVRRYQKSI